MSATISGTTIDTEGNAVSARIVFASNSTPLVLAGGTTVMNTDVTIRSANDGTFSITLEPGGYTVTIYGGYRTQTCTFLIAVPTGGTFTIDEVTVSSLTYVYQTPPSWLTGVPLTGTFNLTQGVSSGTVTGVGSIFSPLVVQLVVESPTGTPQSLFATIVGTPTVNGFGFQLNGAPTSSGCILRWIYYPPTGVNAFTVAIPNTTSTVTVSGLNLAFTPTVVTLTVEMPSSSGETLFATLVGNPTTDGFVAQLSGNTDSTGYLLHCVLT